jgi:asparagine N-glycosylation enzyme membrane subunit Stt3
MVYLAIYPAAIFAAVAIASAERAMLARSRRDRELNGAPGWIVSALLVVIAVPPALTAPRAVPVVDLDLYQAGKWVRANVGQSCVDYLVADAETAYWLHLAVLGNPRSSARMEEIDRYEPNSAMAPWIASAGRGHAIANLRLLPDEVRSRVEIVRTWGSAAVIRQPGATGCRNGRQV